MAIIKKTTHVNSQNRSDLLLGAAAGATTPAAGTGFIAS